MPTQYDNGGTALCIAEAACTGGGFVLGTADIFARLAKDPAV